MDIDAMLASAKLPEETVPLCLRPDLRQQWETLETELINARTQRNTMAPTTREQELAVEIRAVEAEIADNTLKVRMRGLTHQPWTELVAAHPPRKDNFADQNVGINEETFIPALIKAQMIEPVMADEQVEKLLDVISDAQYQMLSNAAWALGRADRNRPVFSRAASLVIPDSGETSRQQSGSGSARRGSQAKNPKSSPSTTTTTTAG